MNEKVSTPQNTRTFYDQMANEYDELWLFDKAVYDQMHPVLVQYAERLSKGRVLDVGCGTGAQSLIMTELGFDVYGIDISGSLLRKAKEKLERNNSAEFIQSSCTNLSFQKQTFDVEVCFYNVLNHVPEYEVALKEMSRVLKTNGLIFLQVDKTSLIDIFYEVLDYILGGRIGYHETKENIVNHLLHHKRNYVITWEEENYITLKCWRFSPTEIGRIFRKEGLTVKVKVGMKIFQSLIPWSLETSSIRPIKTIVAFLGKLDKKISRSWPFNSMGLGTIYVLQKNR
jgi:ubiquinone/menaquinone biosynthesis C-methylase UbiE